MSISLSGITGWYLHKQQQRAIISEFQKDLSLQTLSLYRELNHSLTALDLFSTGFNPQEGLDYFNLNAKKAINTTKEIKSLALITQVKNKDLRTFEHKQQLVMPNFHILVESNTKTLIATKNRQEYFPIVYIFPLEQNYTLLGLDIGSNHDVLKAIQIANESRKVNAVLTSHQSSLHGNLLLGIAPIYSKHSSVKNINVSSTSQFMLAVLDLKSIFTSSVLDSNLSNVDIKVIDNTSSGKDNIIYHHASFGIGSELVPNLTTIARLPEDYTSIDWSIVATPSENYVKIRQNKIPELVFLLGVTFSLLLTAYLQAIIKRTRTITELVKKKTLELKLANNKLMILNHTDALTGVANRRYLDTMLNHEWSRAIRNQSTISFIFIDIDFFKLYNDNYGHVNGDKCLKTVATTLAATLSRPADICARYGGEEFAIILPETQHAEVVAEKCRRAIQNLGIVHKFSTTAETVTISLGVCTIIPQIESNPSTIIEYADHALYQAKSTGKNKVVVIANPLD